MRVTDYACRERPNTGTELYSESLQCQAEAIFFVAHAFLKTLPWPPREGTHKKGLDLASSPGEQESALELVP